MADHRVLILQLTWRPVRACYGFCLGNTFGILVHSRDDGREKTDISWYLAPTEDWIWQLGVCLYHPGPATVLKHRKSNLNPFPRSFRSRRKMLSTSCWDHCSWKKDGSFSPSTDSTPCAWLSFAGWLTGFKHLGAVRQCWMRARGWNLSFAILVPIAVQGCSGRHPCSCQTISVYHKLFPG